MCMSQLSPAKLNLGQGLSLIRSSETSKSLQNSFLFDWLTLIFGLGLFWIFVLFYEFAMCQMDLWWIVQVLEPSHQEACTWFWSMTLTAVKEWRISLLYQLKSAIFDFFEYFVFNGSTDSIHWPFSMVSFHVVLFKVDFIVNRCLDRLWKLNGASHITLYEHFLLSSISIFKRSMTL